MIKKLIAVAMLSLAMAFPVAANTNCMTQDQVIQGFVQIAKEAGDNLKLVYTKTFEDNSVAQFWYKGGDNVLAITFDTDGCASTSTVLTLAEFRDITGVVLAT